MPSAPSLTSVDKTLVVIAGLASKSAKLSTAEKRELKALAVKGTKRGRQGFTVADRARCAWLIRKAGPESLPNVKIPPWLRRLLRLRESSEDGASVPPPIRSAPAVDPLDRLDKLAQLRERSFLRRSSRSSDQGSSPIQRSAGLAQRRVRIRSID
jgi:hypothetical protein